MQMVLAELSQGCTKLLLRAPPACCGEEGYLHTESQQLTCVYINEWKL